MNEGVSLIYITILGKDKEFYLEPIEKGKTGVKIVSNEWIGLYLYAEEHRLLDKIKMIGARWI